MTDRQRVEAALQELRGATVTFTTYEKNLKAGRYKNPATSTAWGRALALLGQIDPATPPPPVGTTTNVPAFQITLQPQQTDEGSDRYSFGWVATKRPTPEPRWAGQGVWEFSDYPQGLHLVQCYRFDEREPGRSPINFHCMPPWELWENSTYNGVSPIAMDYHSGPPRDATGGVQKGLILGLEAELIGHRRGHWQILTEAQINQDRKAAWCSHWHILPRPDRTGFVRVRTFRNGVLFNEVKAENVSTCYPEMEHLYVWTGGYESSGVPAVAKVTVSNDYRGKDLRSALADKPVVGDVWHSRRTGSSPDSSVASGLTLPRPDGALLG